jgi:hypothetical protein
MWKPIIIVYVRTTQHWCIQCIPASGDKVHGSSLMTNCQYVFCSVILRHHLHTYIHIYIHTHKTLLDWILIFIWYWFRRSAHVPLCPKIATVIVFTSWSKELYMTSFPASSSGELQECNCDNNSPCAVVLQHLYCTQLYICWEEGDISPSVQFAVTRQTAVGKSHGIKTPIQLHYAAQIEREEISCILILFVCPISC